MDGTIIALDAGTTQIKSALFDKDGKLLELEKCDTPLRRVGEREFYRPEEIWGIVKAQVESLLQCGFGKTSGIAVTGMAEAGLIVEKGSGKALTDILPWFERCTCPLAERMSSEESNRVFRDTGLRNSFKYGIYKYLWLLEEQKLESEETVWLSMCDYIAFRMTGKMVTDPTFAARTYVYHVREGRWDARRIREYGLCAENFPLVEESGAAFGEFRGIPVAVAGHDHVCAAFGLLYGREGGICDSAGTSETYVGVLGKPPKDQGFSEKSGLLYGPFVDGGCFYMANVPSSGHSVEWFRKRLQLRELTYENMNEKLKELSPGPSGLLYFPYLTGMGAPWYRAEIKGVLMGLEEHRDGITVLKGILEGIQYQARWLLELVEDFHEIHADSLVCAGGSVHNHTMMQIKADILDRSVRVPAVTEATLSGAAALFLKKNRGEGAAEQFLGQAARIVCEYRADCQSAKVYERIFHERYLPFVELMEKTNMMEINW